MNKSAQSDEQNQADPSLLRLHRPPGLTAKGQKRMFVDHHYTDKSCETNEASTVKEREAVSLYRLGQMTGPFPLKLQTLLRVVQHNHLDFIVGWQPHGRSFLIKDIKKFESMFMKYFNQCQLSSFKRQLNLYDFKRITRGPDAGSYYHEMFLRGRPLLAFKMHRIKIKGTKFRATSCPEDEPDFYKMSVLPGVDDGQLSSSHHISQRKRSPQINFYQMPYLPNSDGILMPPRNPSFLQQSVTNPIQNVHEVRGNTFVVNQNVSYSGPSYPSLTTLFVTEVNYLGGGTLAASLNNSSGWSGPTLADLVRLQSSSTSYLGRL